MAMRPVPEMYPVTQNFYANATVYNYGAGHGAIDFGTPTGTTVVAPEDGTVIFADWVWNLAGGPNDWVSRWFLLKPAVGMRTVGGGIVTVLRNDAGSLWIFAHLDTNDVAPRGTRVRKGQPLGRTDHTGSSTGPHLHLQFIPPRPNWNNGYFGSIDPAPFLTERYSPIQATSWVGSATTGRGGTTTTTTKTKDWFDMATEKDLERVLTRVMQTQGRAEIRTGLKTMLSPSSADGKALLGKLRPWLVASVVAAGPELFRQITAQVIPPYGEAKTKNVSWLKSLSYDRHERALEAKARDARAKEYEEIRADLDLILLATAAQSGAAGTTTATTKESTDG